MPLTFTYLTAWATDPTVVQFRDDIYRRDGSEQLAMSDVRPVAYQPGEQVSTGISY